MGQKNTTSLPEQERINREHAAGLGWEVSEPHVYREVEGGEDLYRPHMDRLWDAIMRHEIDALVVDVRDRLSRDEGDAAAVWHHCDRYGVQIELASEDLDDSEHGRNLRTLTGIVARMERADIKRRTQRGRRARAAAGKLFPGPWPLYGYLWGDPAKGQRTYYVVDPETGWIVVLIFERVAAGVPIRRLCKQLEAEGIPTPSQIVERRGQMPPGRKVSGVWHKSTIQRMLKCPAYWGAHADYRWDCRKVKDRPAETGITRKRRVMRPRPESDPARVALPATAAPALVPPELAARALARMASNHAEWAGRPVTDPLATIWRGMAYCGHCGGRLRTLREHDNPSIRRYRCANTERADKETKTRTPCPGGAFTMGANLIDPQGWADVLDWLSDPNNVEGLIADWQERTATTKASAASRLAAVDKTIAKLRATMHDLGHDIAVAKHEASRQTLRETLDEYAAQLEKEEGKRERILQENADA
ncbi:MAG TPA: recombinase family protein, partial [Ktedonobacterales bacterium]|nr:recombinase family protein [Ktedonobacterales bacterium]